MSIYKKKQKTPVYALAIDWETSGAVFGGDSSIDYQGLSFGAVIFNAATFEPVEMIYREIKFNDLKYKWSIEAENIHGLSQDHLLEKGISQEDAASDLVDLIFKYFGTSKVMLLGHNVEFDRKFTNQLLKTVGVEFSIQAEPFDEKNPIAARIEVHHVMLDTSSAGFITMGIYKSDLLFDAVGLNAREKHNALDDALYALETCRRIRLLVDTALAGE